MVRPGQRIDYQILVKSKAGKVTYKLESGPPGLTVSPTGRVRWRVNAGGASKQAVIVTVRDGITRPAARCRRGIESFAGEISGQELIHTFTLDISTQTGSLPTRPTTTRTASSTTRPRISNIPSRRPSTPSGNHTSSNPSEHGLVISLKGNGRLKSLTPNPSFNIQPPNMRLVHKAFGKSMTQRSFTWATVRVVNRSSKTISSLTLLCKSSIPGCLPQTQRITPTTYVGSIRPGAGVQFDVYFKELRNSPSSGAARITFAVDRIQTR